VTTRHCPPYAVVKVFKSRRRACGSYAPLSELEASVGGDFEATFQPGPYLAADPWRGLRASSR
jgi:hypothetical protein